MLKRIIILITMTLLSSCSDYNLSKVTEPSDDAELYPEIEVSPEHLDFGTLNAIGDISSMDISIKNIGNDTLFLDDIILNNQISVYSISNVSDDELEPFEEATLTVTYDPITYETNVNSISIFSNDEITPESTVTIGGIGSAPVISITPEEYDFGEVDIGCDDSTTIQISNIGDVDLIIDDIEREYALKSLKEDDEALALIVRIDSPGGTIVGGENLYYQLKDFSQEKPVVAVMGSTATSAGYMIALGADYLIAREGSLTGSIGVLLQTADVTSLLEKIGIKPEVIKSGPFKAQPNPFEKTTQAARDTIESVVLDMYAVFVDIVAERRKMSPEAVRALADGRVYSGRQALANGLIDAIGSENEALDWLHKTRKIPPNLSVNDVIIERSGQSWRKIVNMLVGKALFSERLNLDGLFSLWQSKLW